VINLSTEAIPKQAIVITLNESKINSLITNGCFKVPVTMSAIAKIHIITNARNPITAFSLIEF
jgi:hypothetical protein